LKQIVFHDIQITKVGAPILKTISDADEASNSDDQNFISTCICFLGSTLISWSSKKQRVVAQSFTEVVYRVLANATFETMWLLNLFTELGLILKTTPQLL
jgi:hypothetical protein